ncbi:ComEA family DNA-binding protein [Arsenicibacter rosenii]|uniref:Transporter n=1 Tax=Arsenicibacter rosenii TaxID=1750698 RepID=A0A1S2VIG0_9BACT|nr:helix-hairpin-helix domain-containing protein [Arsenicibacter rosenii]OIN58534.1 transporter [Arsenicibacter rosenii]
MWSGFRDYFGLSNRQARGALVLILLAVSFLLITFLYRFREPEPLPDTTAADQRKLDSLVALMEHDDKEAAASRLHRDGESGNQMHSDPPARRMPLHAFDPNRASVAEWQALGVPRWLAERIEKYRSRGGQFRQKEDVQKIYDFPPALYQELEPYMTLPERSAAPEHYAANRPFSAESGKRFESSSRPERTKPLPVQPFDINTADTLQLAALKGIGNKLANRIIKFRDALGGFVSTEQFGDIYGLDSLALAELRNVGHIRSAPKKININTASAEELDRHVYLSRRQAEIIVRYREQHGAFTSPESLKPIRVLDVRTIERLTPYLAF